MADLIGAVKGEECGCPHKPEDGWCYFDGKQWWHGIGFFARPARYCTSCGSQLGVTEDGQPYLIPAARWQAMAEWLAGWLINNRPPCGSDDSPCPIHKDPALPCDYYDVLDCWLAAAAQAGEDEKTGGE